MNEDASSGSLSGRRILALATVAILCGISVWMSPSRADEESSQSAVRSSRASRSSRTSATNSDGEAKINAKLDQVLDNQQQILNRLNEVMEELKIIKIRATLR